MRLRPLADCRHPVLMLCMESSSAAAEQLAAAQHNHAGAQCTQVPSASTAVLPPNRCSVADCTRQELTI